MSVILSVATSANGFIDDNHDQRLILSTPEDWKEVLALRSKADAIVIGAETLRRDNPRLSLKSDALREQRVAAGLSPEPHKVIISGSGVIDPSLRLFNSPYKNIIIFSQIPREELETLAEIIVEPNITPAFIITELEKRKISRLFIEGGAKILDMFLESRCVNKLRIATNPVIQVTDEDAPRFNRPEWLDQFKAEQSNIGGMHVEIFSFKQSQHEKDLKHLLRAIELSRKCTPSESSYCVGAVVVTGAGEIFEGYTHESSPTHHAEQEAIKKAKKAHVKLEGATMYSSIEPCSERSSEPESCSEIIIRHKFKRAIFALYEPSCFVKCNGALNMRMAGIDVECINSLSALVRDVNSHLDF